MSIPWSNWTPHVAPDVPGCPSPLIETAVRDAVIGFCQRSGWLVRSITADAAAGTSARTFTALVGAGERVLRVRRAWFQGDELNRLPPAAVADGYGWPDWPTMTGTPVAFVQERDDEYWLVPAPSATVTGALRLELVLSYLVTATECDRLFWDRWRLAIAHGAMSTLLLTAGSWNDPQRAGEHALSFAVALADARVEAARSPTRAPLKTRAMFY